MSSNCSPLVSVIMPVFNGEKYLAEAIESILTQTYTQFELLIVDDASEDGSAEIIRSYEKRDDRIRYIRHERNLGHSSARNTGIAASRGKCIAAIDCDDICLPRRLQKQVDFLQLHPEIGVVGTCMTSVGDDLHAIKHNDVPQPHAFIVFDLLVGHLGLAGASIMARREVLNAVDGYEPSRRALDDTDLFVRLAENVRFANLPERLYLYRRHEKQSSTINRQRNLEERRALRERWLHHQLGAASIASLDRLERLRSGMKFSWVERRLLRRDLERLIEAMIAAGFLRADDRLLLDPEIARRLESTTPRLWQMFCHWRRYNFGR